MKQELSVYLHQVYAGRLTRDAFGTMSFTYDSTYVEKNRPILSLSLPLRRAPYRGGTVNAFFFGSLPGFLTVRRTSGRLIRWWLWNCLPDQLVRDYKKRYIGLAGLKCWAWLVDKGIEAGAISLHHPKFASSPLVPVDETEIVLDDRVITQINKNPESHASVFGKHVMIPARIDGEGRVVFVKGRSPTLSTHFVKYMDKRGCRALNELFCMRLARSVGLDVPDVELRTIDGNFCYLIKRYDRVQSGHITKPYFMSLGLTSESLCTKPVEMLHQESLCQALEVPVGVWLERHGGPSIKQSLALLSEHSAKPEQDKAEFLARLVFGYLVGCLDINGRNVSMLYRKGCSELAPAYDLSVSDPFAKFPISIGGVRRPEDVHVQHWYSVVENREKHVLYRQLERLSQDCWGKANELVNEMESEGLQSNIYSTVRTRISQRADRIRRQLPEWPKRVDS